jgi:hypothetical protein
MIEFSEFVRQPFRITAVQITDDNMEEACKIIGLGIGVEQDGSRHIVVNKSIVPYGGKVYAGWWITKMGKKTRCYSNKLFTLQFTPMTDEWIGWFESEEAPDEVVEETVVTELTTDPQKPQVGDTFDMDVNEPYTDGV